MTDLLDPSIDPDIPAEGQEGPHYCATNGGPGDCSFEAVSIAGLRRHQTRQHNMEPAGHSRKGTDGGAASRAVPPGPGAAPSGPPERPPRPKPRPGVIGRLRNRVRQGKGAEPGSAAPKRAPLRYSIKNRIPVDADVTSAWFYAGRQLEGTGYYPVGRMLSYEALAAGPIIDEAVTGTAADRWVIQPIWRQKDRYEKVFYLVGPVMFIAMLQSMNLRAQAAYAAGDLEEARKVRRTMQGWEQFAGSMMRSAMVQMAPSIALAKERIAAEDAAIREAFPDLPPGADPIQALFSDLFAPPGANEPPTPPEEEAADHEYSSSVYANGAADEYGATPA